MIILLKMIESFSTENRWIALMAALWRELAISTESLAVEGLYFLKGLTN
jgi:hypothetical protein